MSKTLQEQEQKKKKKIDYSKHQNYDEVCKKMRKLLGSAESFIRDACEGLREDWYPELSQEQIKHEDVARNEIREKIFEDWCNETSTLGVWSDARIRFSLPDWVKNPNKQIDPGPMLSAKENNRLRSQAIAMQEQKPAIERLVDKLPEPVILPEPKEEDLPTSTAYVKSDAEVEQEEEIRRADTQSPFRRIGKINESIADLWTALTGLEDMPHMKDDGEVKGQYIKPTKEFRTDIANGTPKTERIQIHNYITWLELALDDMKQALKKGDDTAFDRS